MYCIGVMVRLGSTPQLTEHGTIPEKHPPTSVGGTVSSAYVDAGSVTWQRLNVGVRELRVGRNVAVGLEETSLQHRLSGLSVRRFSAAVCDCPSAPGDFSVVPREKLRSEYGMFCTISQVLTLGFTPQRGTALSFWFCPT